jgi:hypothetical protein
MTPGVRLRSVLLTGALLVGLAVSLLHERAAVPVQAAQGASVSTSTDVTPPFTDRTAGSGLDFVHRNDAAGALLLPEVIGAGGAVFDYDNDGDLDVFAVQSGKGGDTPGSRLYRNESRPADRLRFSDVTGGSRIVADGYGMGAAAGDIDNDGWIDLYVTGLGAAHLLRNNGDGTFADVTAKSGAADTRWSTSAAFVDFDRDGWLDLFVARYVHFTASMRRACFSAGSARDYCNPSVYDPVPARLLRNNRDGTFVDVSARAGLTGSPARGLGVLASDFNADGWTDLFVANDGDPNHLWLNDRGTGRFTDGALLAGVALSRAGQAQGSMGVDAGDVDADGDEDLFVTNLDNEGPVLYRQISAGVFEDRAVEAGLFRLGFTGFGTRFVDYDNDGWLDVIVTNGAVRHLHGPAQRADPYPLKQRSQLFRNVAGRFTDVSAGSGGPFAELRVGRGLAAGDLDNDGDIDIVVFDNNGPARVLVNERGDQRHWLGVRAVDGQRRRDAMHARVVLESDKGAGALRVVRTDGSYASASDPRVLFGLGDNAAPRTVTVHWPEGGTSTYRDLTVDRYWLLERGKPSRPWPAGLVAGARPAP